MLSCVCLGEHYVSVIIQFHLCLIMWAHWLCTFVGVKSRMRASRDFWGYENLLEYENVSKIFPRNICQHLVGPGCEGYGSQRGEFSKSYYDYFLSET